jgi:hypothetical protein
LSRVLLHLSVVLNFVISLGGGRTASGKILMLVWGATFGQNFDIKIGRAAREAPSAIWNLGTNSAFAVGPRKTTENLERV